MMNDWTRGEIAAELLSTGPCCDEGDTEALAKAIRDGGDYTDVMAMAGDWETEAWLMQWADELTNGVTP